MIVFFAYFTLFKPKTRFIARYDILLKHGVKPVAATNRGVGNFLSSWWDLWSLMRILGVGTLLKDINSLTKSYSLEWLDSTTLWNLFSRMLAFRKFC